MKQRLVGAIVLGCLAIIFLPILLDGEGVRPPTMNASIPAAPSFPEPLIIDTQRPVLSDSSDGRLGNTPDSNIENDQNDLLDKDTLRAPVEELASENRAVVEQGPSLDSEGLPEAWSVRLGIFGEAENAESLTTRLLQQNYRAYNKTMRAQQGELIAVFVGPVLSLVEAESLKKELATEFDLDGLIVDFSIDGVQP